MRKITVRAPLLLMVLMLVSCGSDAPEDLSDPSITLAQLEDYAEGGNLEAMHQLGRAYSLGERGTEIDRGEAISWYLKAAAKGYAKSQNNLGSIYFEGGPDRNPAVAFEWFLKAAEQGFAIGQNNLAIAYEYGEGTDRDLEKAKEWYQKAAHQGAEPAKDAMARLQKESDLFDIFAEMYRISAGSDVETTSQTLSFKGEPIIGVRSAPFTAILYLSPECKHCSHFVLRPYARLMRDYVNTGNVNLVVRFLPISSVTDFYGAMTARCMAQHGSSVGEFWFSLVDNWHAIGSKDRSYARYSAKSRFTALADHFSKLEAEQQCWTKENANKMLREKEDLAAYYNGIGHKGSIGVPLLIIDANKGNESVSSNAMILRGAAQNATREELAFFDGLNAAIAARAQSD